MLYQNVTTIKWHYMKLLELYLCNITRVRYPLHGKSYIWPCFKLWLRILGIAASLGSRQRNYRGGSRSLGSVLSHLGEVTQINKKHRLRRLSYYFNSIEIDFTPASHLRSYAFAQLEQACDPLGDLL